MVNDLTDFQLYQRFRLEMVQRFGSLACALFEFGADPETGRLGRAVFVDAVSSCMGFFTELEANQVFGHITNSDPGLTARGGHMTHRDVGISDEEWHAAAKQKLCKDKSAPFASGPSGMSMGVFHRPITIGIAISSRPKDSAGDGVQSPGACGSDSSPMRATAESFARANHLAHHSAKSGRRRHFSWRRRHRPWAPSIFAGPVDKTESFGAVVSRRGSKLEGDPADRRVFDGCCPSPPARAAQLYTRPRHSQLEQQAWKRPGEADRSRVVATFRAETEKLLQQQEVATWWPYSGKVPQPQAELNLKRLTTLHRAAGAQRT